MSTNKKIEKQLSYILRHHPESVGISLTREGWANVGQLLFGLKLTWGELNEIVVNSEKRRFEYDDTGTLIRACQGHSIDVDLGLSELKPPHVLYHGTALANVSSIQEKGLIKGTRQHVHLSEDMQTAAKVGRRKGEPVILIVKARLMELAGHKFYQSTNGVWLTDRVPSGYIEFP